MKKIIFVLLCLVYIISLAACSINFGNTNTNRAEAEVPNTPSTSVPANDPAPTEPPSSAAPSETVTNKIADPKDGTVLEVDLTVRGETKSNAPAMNSKDFIFEGTTLQLPFAGSVLAQEGWRFSENTTAKDAVVDPNSVADLVSFYLCDTDGNEILLYQAVNDSSTAKPVLECQISSFEVDTSSLNETFGDLILPGGVCLRSTAADVIAVFGGAENNSNFARVEVFEHGIRYVENNASGLCYTFHFYDSEDYSGELNGYIHSIQISTDY